MSFKGNFIAGGLLFGAVLFVFSRFSPSESIDTKKTISKESGISLEEHLANSGEPQVKRKINWESCLFDRFDSLKDDECVKEIGFDFMTDIKRNFDIDNLDVDDSKYLDYVTKYASLSAKQCYTYAKDNDVYKRKYREILSIYLKKCPVLYP